MRIEAQTYVSSVTDDAASWIGEAQTYLHGYTNPVVLGQVMTENDPDWSVFWCYGASRDSPPDAIQLNTGKTVCEDVVTNRADELIGIVVFEAGHGSIAGIEYEAAVGLDSIGGVDDGPPFSHSFAQAFAAAPEIAVVTLAGLDGRNGGWAQTHGLPQANATQLFLSVDEDQIADPERSHTTEQVGYVAFEAAFVTPFTCMVDTDCDDGSFCNGAESCQGGLCQGGSDPCFGAPCDEPSDTCINAPVPRLEVIRADVGAVGEKIHFTNLYVSPVLVCTVHYDNNIVPVVPRISQLNPAGFVIRLENPSGATPTFDDVSCLVVEEGDWTVDGVKISAMRFASTRTDHAASWVGRAAGLRASIRRTGRARSGVDGERRQLVIVLGSRRDVDRSAGVQRVVRSGRRCVRIPTRRAPTRRWE